MKTETIVDCVIAVALGVLSTAIVIVTVELAGRDLVRDVRVFLKFTLSIALWCVSCLAYIEFKPTDAE